MKNKYFNQRTSLLSKKADIDKLPVETEDENNDDDLLDNENSLTSISQSPKNTIKKRSQARIIRSVWFNKEAQPEKHYRELIMLFTPWRNEQTDLMGSFSFEEHYIARYNEISEQMRQYAVCSEDLIIYRNVMMIYMTQLHQSHKTLNVKIRMKVIQIHIQI